MNQHYEAFRKKLQEIFMMDHAELDFGIYRIMNHKRNQINDFLDEQLLPQVEKTLQEYVKTDDSLQQELNKAIEGCKNLGIDPDTNPKVQQLRQQIAQSSTGIDDLQNTVFSRLTQFFSRYYEGGDFVSQRRYKSGGNSAYAIPYNGEEVKLYWANYDQYYIKTSEYFKNYTFKLRDGRRICFVLVDASTEQNNNKNTNGMERRFDILRTEEGKPVIEEVDGELHISFTYELMPKATKQKDLNGKAFEALTAVIPSAWNDLLTKEQVTDSSVLLEKHINAYTAKNSFDYFIHKDLRGFLSRELDFYIKNEVFVIADLDAAKLQSQLAVVKTIEKVGQKIIDFLAQLENFQKKLWLKKKFVVQSDYCITLDRVPEIFYPEICANDEQRKEWVHLFAIDEIKGDGLFAKGYSEPLTIDFLKQNPFLVLDTKYFPLSFKHKLMAEIEDLDEQCDGLLVRSENLQALLLLQQRFAKAINCIYIDPPFNLKVNGDFLYRTDYKDSTWNTLLHNRIEITTSLLSDNSFFYLRCDNNGNHLARHILDETLGAEHFLAELLVQRIRKNVTSQGRISLPLANDSLFLYSNTEDYKFNNPYTKLKEARESYWRRVDDSSGFRNPPERVIFGKTFLPYKHEAHFKYSQESMDRMIEEGKLRIICKQCGEPHYKGVWEKCPKCGCEQATPQYLVGETDKIILDTNWTDIAGYSSKTGFSTENAEILLNRALEVCSSENDLVCDYFGGSGTTMAVAMQKNRKWLGVEMGDQYEIFIRPRLKQIMHKGHSCYFKYIRLEQYEDTLNNLKVKDSFGKNDNESYMLRYMLDTETRDSLINTKDFVRPFDYTIKTTRDNELVDTPVDLVDTFNYLIGLHVDSIHWHKDDNICVVEGTTHIEKEHALIIWRNQDVIKNDDLNDFFRKQDYSTLDREFDVIYVNGDNTLPNIKSDEEHWKVRLIEQELMKRMFEEE
jgi:adenine-specific DNA-methyltransferase